MPALGPAWLEPIFKESGYELLFRPDMLPLSLCYLKKNHNVIVFIIYILLKNYYVSQIMVQLSWCIKF